MSLLPASITGLSGSAERTSVRGRAVTRNMAKLAAGVALHGLSLAVARVMVGSYKPKRNMVSLTLQRKKKV